MDFWTRKVPGLKQTAAVTAPPPALPAPGWLLLLLNWLVPGAGFWLCGRRTRGAGQFVLVIITFILGLTLHSGVAWPSWLPSAADFNLINNFTFVVQLGAGLPALLSLLAQRLPWSFLAGLPQHPYYELGGYYLIVAGAINYFAVCNLYDRLIHTQPRYLAQEGKEEAPQP